MVKSLKFLLPTILLFTLVTPVSAGRPDPTGSFTITPSAPYVQGETITFTVQTTGVNQKHEVTIGIDCWRPDGTPVLMYNPIKDTYGLYELTSIRGKWMYPQSLVLWYDPSSYTCRARLAIILWEKGIPTQAWTADEERFNVGL